MQAEDLLREYAKEGKLEELKAALKQRTRIDFLRANCLNTAVEYGQLEVVQWLYAEFDFFRYMVVKECGEMLDVASACGHDAVYKWLLEHCEFRHDYAPWSNEELSRVIPADAWVDLRTHQRCVIL